MSRAKGLGVKAIECKWCGYGLSYSIFKMDNDGNMETWMQCGKCKVTTPADKEDIAIVQSQNKEGGYFRDFIYKGEDRKRYGSKYLRDEEGNIIGEKDE